jgi:hypothetical protein
VRPDHARASTKTISSTGACDSSGHDGGNYDALAD